MPLFLTFGSQDFAFIPSTPVPTAIKAESFGVKGERSKAELNFRRAAGSSVPVTGPIGRRWHDTPCRTNVRFEWKADIGNACNPFGQKRKRRLDGRRPHCLFGLVIQSCPQ